MKYLVLFVAFLCCESVAFSEPTTIQVTKVYVIHKEKRPFVRKPMRRYLHHKKVVKKKIIKNRRNHIPLHHKN